MMARGRNAAGGCSTFPMLGQLRRRLVGVNSRRSWWIFAAGIFAYVVAVLQRSSLGVAGVDASERFSSGASGLASLGVLQLLVYAVLQIPVGVLIDRLGPKALLAGGAAFMVIGQTIVALSPDLSGAIIGRILVGAGDAATFTSGLRLINTWFSGHRVPQLAQWFGNTGQLGQVLSALPFAAILHTAGWEPAFLSAAALSVITIVVVVALVSDGKGVLPAAEGAATIRVAVAELRASLRRPGTQLGFWAHFVTQSSGTVFTLFWGYPFMVFGLGLSTGLAAGLLTVTVLTGLISGPILGLLTVRHPLRRSNIVLGIVLLMALAWGAVLLWPEVPPIWLIVVLLVTMGVGGPGSQIGFDFARTFNPKRSLGSANGVVNVGGFTASFVMMLLIGFLLDVQLSAGLSTQLYSLGAFRVALAVQYPVVGIGVILLIVARRRTRRYLEEEEGIAVSPLWVALSEELVRRRARRGRPEAG